MTRPLLIALLLSCCTPAFAIYKCETGGKTSYSDTPCPNGTIMDAAKLAPPPTDSLQAERQLAQQKKEAGQLRQARQQREAAEERQQHKQARAYAAKQKKCTSSALRKKWAEEDAAQANGKAAPKAVRTARRATEKHELECGK